MSLRSNGTITALPDTPLPKLLGGPSSLQRKEREQRKCGWAQGGSVGRREKGEVRLELLGHRVGAGGGAKIREECRGARGSGRSLVSSTGPLGPAPQSA